MVAGIPFEKIQALLDDNPLRCRKSGTLGPHQVRPAGHTRKAELVGPGGEGSLVEASHTVPLQVEHVQRNVSGTCRREGEFVALEGEASHGRKRTCTDGGVVA